MESISVWVAYRWFMAYRPVYKLARPGEHGALCPKCFANLTPSAAKMSRFGVLRAGWPAQLSASPRHWSQLMKSRFMSAIVAHNCHYSGLGGASGRQGRRLVGPLRDRGIFVHFSIFVEPGTGHCMYYIIDYIYFDTIKCHAGVLIFARPRVN